MLNQYRPGHWGIDVKSINPPSVARLESLLLGLVNLLLLVLVDNAIVIGVSVLFGDGSLTLDSVEHLKSARISRSVSVRCLKYQSSDHTHSCRFVLVF